MHYWGNHRGDLRRHMDTLMQATAGDIAGQNPVTVTPDMFAAEALNIMNTKKSVCYWPLIKTTCPLASFISTIYCAQVLQKIFIIIPARYASTRYQGKLVELTLPDGARKSLIQLSWTACRVTGADAVYVATDDARIRDAAQAFGADVIMTSETRRNGTERCAEALENAAPDADLIVNLQGDAP